MGDYEKHYLKRKVSIILLAPGNYGKGTIVRNVVGDEYFRSTAGIYTINCDRTACNGEKKIKGFVTISSFQESDKWHLGYEPTLYKECSDWRENLDFIITLSRVDNVPNDWDSTCLFKTTCLEDVKEMARVLHSGGFDVYCAYIIKGEAIKDKNNKIINIIKTKDLRMYEPFLELNIWEGRVELYNPYNEVIAKSKGDDKLNDSQLKELGNWLREFVCCQIFKRP